MDSDVPRGGTLGALTSPERDFRLARAMAEVRRALRAASAEDRALVLERLEALARRRPA